MKKLWLLLFLGFTCCFYAHGQPEIAKTVIAPGGGTLTNNNISLSFTIAELSLVNTFSSGTTELLNGFQNDAYAVISSINQNESNTIPFTVFPNPVSDKIFVDTKGSNGSMYLISLTDMMGRIIYKEQINNINVQTGIDISSISEGIYSISVLDSSNKRKHNQLINITH